VGKEYNNKKKKKKGDMRELILQRVGAKDIISSKKTNWNH